MEKTATLTKDERRLKREARREKQRGENVGRAAKMHVARLLWEEEIKPSPLGEKAPSGLEVHVGCSGWFY